MRANHILPLALILGCGLGGGAIAQGAQPDPLTKREIQALQREGSIAANLETAYEASVQAHAASVMGRNQLALNRVFDARTRLQSIQNLGIGDPDLNRSLNQLITLTSVAQRRLISRSPASSEALQELVVHFNRTVAALPMMGGGGGGQTVPILSQKLALELVSDSYRSLANAQTALVRGNQRAALLWLEESQLQLNEARQAPGQERLTELLASVGPAIETAQRQIQQGAPEALDATARAVERMAVSLSAIR